MDKCVQFHQGEPEMNEEDVLAEIAKVIEKYRLKNKA